jgi:hypothetical protein
MLMEQSMKCLRKRVKLKSDFMKNYCAKIFIIGCSCFFLGSVSSPAEDYTVIIEKNLFSPTRKKWVTPPKTPAKKQISKAMMPELCGTIISDDKKLAVLSFRRSTAGPVIKTSSKQTKQTKQTRKSKRTIRSRKPSAPATASRTTDTRIVSVGDRFGDYRLVAIEDKQVTLEYDGQKIQLYTQR